MHPEDIKAAIRKAGWTLTELAGTIGVPKQVVSLALQARVNERAERAIADCIDMEPAAIWPSRYRRDGQRIVLRRGRPAA